MFASSSWMILPLMVYINFYSLPVQEVVCPSCSEVEMQGVVDGYEACLIVMHETEQ